MLTNNGNGGFGMNMDVVPAYGGGNNGWGGDWAWILLLLLIGGNGWGFGGYGGAMMGMDMGLYPWLNNSQNINDGFRDQMLTTQISSIGDKVSAGFGDVQLGIAGVNQAICQTGNGVTAAVTGAQNALSQQLYTNQLADLERSFAAQTASTQGMTALQAQLAQCCCDNRMATADTKYALATEACATRTANAENTNALMSAITAGIQSIKDDLCNDRLEAERRENANLRTQLSMAQLSASQNAQTAAILTDNLAQTNALEQYLAPVPRPAYIVQNPSCCAQNYGGYGCGCGVA